MKFTISQIAQIINATIEGDENLEISSLGKIESAEPGNITFLANPKYEEFV